jgi:tetratricopeptide (TPR) repeat protein
MVKNEAHVVERALRSAKPLVDAWLVVDTGSTDGTRTVVERAMEGLPGKVVDRPWKNFGANRTETLELARELGDYALVLDADDTFDYPDGARWPELDLPGYLLTVRDAGVNYHRLHLLRLDADWRYVGVVHEYAHSDTAGQPGIVTGIEYVRHYDGARWKDPGKYLKDAGVLAKALAEDPGNARTVFYLAQSYRDAGVLEEALKYFRQRVTMGGFPEEVYVAQLWAARIRSKLGAPKEEIWTEFLRAYQLRPTRHEALVDLAEACRKTEDYGLAHMFACRADELPPSGDSLFVEVGSRVWRPRDERAIAAYYLGFHEESRRINEALLADPKVPESEKPRIRDNLAFTKPKA